MAHLNVAHTKLRNLAGLRGINIVNGDLIIWDNPNMINLQGLGPITQLYGKLWIDSNAALEDMTGLEVRVSSNLVAVTHVCWQHCGCACDVAGLLYVCSELSSL